MNGNELAAKYKSRAHDSAIEHILKLMEEHGVTYQELQAYQKVNDVDMRRKLLKIRKTQRLRGLEDGRRGRKEI